MSTLKVLSKAKEAILYLCRRCDEQGFYTPPRQKLIEDALNQLEAESTRLTTELIEAGEYFIACEKQNISLLEAMGYPPHPATMISPEEYAAELKRKADELDRMKIVGAIHKDTLRMHLDKPDDLTPSAMWKASKANFSTDMIPVYVLKAS